MRVLLLGGTAEARDLADRLDGVCEVVSSLAGRVRRPLLPAGEVRVGGFGGEQGFRDFVQTGHIDAVIDATHPFARAMTATAAKVASEQGIPYVRVQRPAWEPSSHDHWISALDVREAAQHLVRRYEGGISARALVTIGRQELAALFDAPIPMVARMIDPPAVTPPSHVEILCARGPFALADELSLLERIGADVVVTKNSGGSATYPKILAARRLQIPVVMIDRPPLPARALVVPSAVEAIRWVTGLQTL
ncbi:cobalt-precorrin-6A reductase [Hoyosella rhizosphaerae]|uniref:Precorrin-6A reductase n=1 Tax=Hoyosella rhizosphaerae TaxID=1755582 RepID=A0A916TZZ7_9ACTN|nr:cobalt-precorrin-6A reductase [Hoyosella rhizosphaerae]MBN4927067.1 cobalt-precorrin-6A reductase [Hoyosella rhizosphaerae]GGC54305.1 precorrin-6A reductase [Hoyosella rhizosphaerae]